VADKNRRDFIKAGSVIAAAAAVGLAPRVASGSPIVTSETPGESNINDLALRALDAARSAGANYADVRISRNRAQSIFTRERRVQNLVDTETMGFGVRVLVDGAWGFAASRELTNDEVVRVARQAVDQARANRSSTRRPVVLAPTPGRQRGTWRSPAKQDPFDVAVEDKIALLLAANEAALKVDGARFVSSNMFFLREEKTLATTDDTLVVQTIYRTSPNMTVTAVGRGDFQTRDSAEVAPMALGYEHVLGAKLVENAPRWAEEAVQKLSAKPVEVGRYDLVLDYSNLGLTVHEAIAHPTELDRAMGFEANYAGTSFVAPPEKVLGTLKFGSPIMNVKGDRSQPGSLASCGWDDEGVVPEEFDIVKDGIFVDYQTTREQALWLADYYRRRGMPVRSHGCSYAQSWADAQFQRMPNVSLMPGPRDLSFEDVVAATDRGIAIIGDGSFSIDQQRYNGQFGGQLFYEIRNGKLGDMLKDVAYQFRTPEFWASMDLVGGRKSYALWGAFGDAKGQPVQSNAVSHGCPAVRFRQVNIINTGRQA
jgi:TldD protein